MFNFLEKYRVYLVYLPLVIYWIVLLVLTSLPSTMAITSGVSDKIEHFGAYAILGALLFLAFRFQGKYAVLKKNASLFAFLISAFYGMLDELHQLFVPGRSADIIDWIADFAGAGLAVLIINFLLKRYLSKKAESNSKQI